MTERDPYFATDTGVAASTARFLEVAGISTIEVVPGLVFRPVLGQRVLVNFVHFEPNTEAPMHTHEEEQVVVVLKGEIEFDVAGEVRTIGPGGVIHIPPHVPHAARTHDTSCDEMDIFAPPRRALVDLMEAAAETPEA
jgi:quercetin dioxygenase-like cupin family protein